MQHFLDYTKKCVKCKGKYGKNSDFRSFLRFQGAKMEAVERILDSNCSINPRHDKSVFRFFEELSRGMITKRPKLKSQRTKEPYEKDSLAYLHFAELERDHNDELIKSPVDFHTCRTEQTLRGYLLNEDYAWFSMHGYCTSLGTSKPKYDDQGNQVGIRGGRRTDTLRYLNGIGIDIDKKLADWFFLGQFFDDAKLPYPNVINETKRGYHVYWLFDERVKAFDGNKKKYNYIIRNINIALNDKIELMDDNAKDIVRYLQVPRNIVYADYERKHSFDYFVDWLNNHGPCNYKNYKDFYKKQHMDLPEGINAPLVKVMKELEDNEADEGVRNITCFVLACYYYNLGYSETRAANELIEWNHRHGHDRFNGQKPHTERQVLNTLRGVYRKGYSIPYKVIRDLTGYNCTGFYKVAKPRTERIRSHNKEYLKDILLSMCEMQIGVIYGTQKELAEMFNIPLSTFKDIIKQLQRGKYGRLLIIRSEGRGRYARTFIQLNTRVFKKYEKKQLGTYIMYVINQDDLLEDKGQVFFPILMGGRGSP